MLELFHALSRGSLAIPRSDNISQNNEDILQISGALTEVDLQRATDKGMEEEI